MSLHHLDVGGGLETELPFEFPQEEGLPSQACIIVHKHWHFAIKVLPLHPSLFLLVGEGVIPF